MMLEEATAPAEEPISVAEAKSHAIIEHTDDDDGGTGLISAYITSARHYVEAWTGRQLVSATYDLFLDEWPQVIYLPRPPATAVTHIKYYDNAEVLQTLSSDDYQTDFVSEPARVMPVYGAVWPNLYPDKFAAITVRFVTGYADAASVPEHFRTACRALVAHWYERRTPVAELRMVAGKEMTNVQHLLDALLTIHRVWRF